MTKSEDFQSELNLGLGEFSSVVIHQLALMMGRIQATELLVLKMRAEQIGDASFDEMVVKHNKAVELLSIESLKTIAALADNAKNRPSPRD